jgi:hypothetical protein
MRELTFLVETLVEAAPGRADTPLFPAKIVTKTAREQRIAAPRE